MSDLAARMMKKFLKDEDGASAASGSAGAAAGASVTGNAGLSSLGAPPSGALGMVGKKRKSKNRECRSCGYMTQHENVKICYECGDRLPKVNEKSISERLADYRTEQVNVHRGNNPYDWINPAVDQIFNMMQTGHPEVLHESDQIGSDAFRERVYNMLHGFENWRQLRTQGNLH